MTRDEAISELKRLPHKVDHGSDYIKASILVDGLVALGLLKLDEPKTAEQKLHDAVVTWGLERAKYADLPRYLKAAGLKVVEA